MRYLEDDAERKREEIINLRAARTEASEKLAQATKERDAARVESERLHHDSQQHIQESERRQRKRFSDEMDESARRQRRAHDEELGELKLRLEESRRAERLLLEGKSAAEQDLRRARDRVVLLEGQLKSAQDTINDLREMISILKQKNQEEAQAAAVEVGKKKAAQEEEARKKKEAEEEEEEKKKKLVPSPPSASPAQKQQQQRGPETLTTISGRTGISISELLASNPGIANAQTPLVKGTRVILPPIRNDDQKSAETSTTELPKVPASSSSVDAAASTPASSSSVARPSLDSSILHDQGTNAFWNSLEDLIVRIGLVPPADTAAATAAADKDKSNRVIDRELLLELNEELVDSLDKPLPPGANVILPVRYDYVPSLAAIRSRLNLQADGGVRLRDGPEPGDATKPLPPGSVVTVTRSLQNPNGATIRQLASRLSMEPMHMLEANPSVSSVDELIPFYKTIFVPRREDPQDSLSVSWRRTRATSSPQARGMSGGGGSGFSSQPISDGSSIMGSSGVSADASKRPPWTLEETSKRCGVTFDELMRVNSASFPGTCRIPEDLLPHFVPFKFILRPFRSKVQPTRLQDLSRMLKIPVEELLKVNSGVSSGTALLYPGQTVKVPSANGNYLLDADTGDPLTVAQVAQLLCLSPVEFLKDNHRAYLNLSQRVTDEFYVLVRDVDAPNFGDFTMQLGVIDPIQRKADLKKTESQTKFFDRLRDAMDFGPREDPNYEDEEDLEEEAATALRKKRRNSNDYWMQQRAVDNERADDESESAREAHRKSTWETGWVSRVSVRDQKVAESARRMVELEEAERTSQARVRHLPLLASASRRSQSAASNDESVAESGGGSQHASPSRPTSAALLRLSQHTPPPLANLDLPPRPNSAAALRNQVGAVRGGALVDESQPSQQQQQQQHPLGAGNAMPEQPQRAPRKPEIPDELQKYLSRDVTATVKENTLEFFDFNPWKKMMNDDLFRHIIELLSKKQCQTVHSIYFAGVTGVTPDAVLKGVALMAAYGTKFREFTTDAMQFPPGAMAQLKLILARKEELRGTKWIFESCLASQRSVMHLRGKKLTDASAVLLDALDEMHAAQHKLNILDLRDNFLTNDTGRHHVKNILSRDWSAVTQVLLDGNPDFDDGSKKEVSELAEKKDKKLLLWAQFVEQCGGRSPSGRASPFDNSATTTTTVRPLSASRMNQRSADVDVFEDRSLSPTQKRFMKRFG